jgi:hypothetical protein
MIKFYQFGHWNVGFFSCAEQSNTKLFKYYMEQNSQEDYDTDDVRNDDDEDDDDEDDKYKHKDDLRSETTVAKVNRRHLYTYCMMCFTIRDSCPMKIDT